MYFIKKITLDSKKNYQVSKIIKHTNKTISVALKLLESSVREYIYDECGREASIQTSITDIDKIENIVEPILDGIVLYRLESDMFRIFVYKKKTTTSQGWIKTSFTSTFYLANIFELEEYTYSIDILNNSINVLNSKTDTMDPPGGMVAIGPAKIKIPKLMTVAPMINLIDELKKSDKFKNRFESISKNSEIESKISQIEIISPTVITFLAQVNDTTNENSDKNNEQIIESLSKDSSQLDSTEN